jgi:hypothetical protein
MALEGCRPISQFLDHHIQSVEAQGPFVLWGPRSLPCVGSLLSMAQLGTPWSFTRILIYAKESPENYY